MFARTLIPRLLFLACTSSFVASSFSEQQVLHDLPGSATSHSWPWETHQFTLRHILLPAAKIVHRVDTANRLEVADESSILLARSEDTLIQRLSDRRPSTVEKLLSNVQARGQPSVQEANAWTLEHVPGPNVTDRETVLTLAIMAFDAYAPDTSDPAWLNLTGGFNRSQSFGWEAYGIRGHVFADQDNSTIVVAIKGTEKAAFDGAGTSTKDKINDNLFFSCCCAQQGHILWHQVCSCATNTYQCDKDCLIRELTGEDHYYRAALELYGNVTELYPDSFIWLTGHSLGGALSSLLGLTYGHSAVTFEAPPDALAAERLGLPLPPGSTSHQRRLHTGAYHFGNTADPIYMGSCHSSYSLCSMWGYAFESQCHTGQRCVYDTIRDKGWWQSIAHHGIEGVIKDVITSYEEVPKCEPEDIACVDCFNWRFDGTITTSATLSTSTSTSPTKSYTRTETCKTPGWWHCLDKTSSSRTVSTTSERTPTTTCRSPGWFGCNDPSSTASTSSTTASAPILSSYPLR